MRTRVKICGVTRREDALEAAHQGADAIGLVFFARSPRAVQPDQARGIIAGLPPFVTVVGLFVDERPAGVRQVLDALRIDLLQFHGDESPAQCASFGKPFIKAVRMRCGIDLEQVCERYRDAAALLVDTYRPGKAGGTGEVFDWSLIPPRLAHRVILAGGLNPENVEQAVRRVRPYAVDVSGGVESSKGIKDRRKIAAFLRGVRCGIDS